MKYWLISRSIQYVASYTNKISQRISICHLPYWLWRFQMHINFIFMEVFSINTSRPIIILTILRQPFIILFMQLLLRDIKAPSHKNMFFYVESIYLSEISQWGQYCGFTKLRKGSVVVLVKFLPRKNEMKMKLRKTEFINI